VNWPLVRRVAWNLTAMLLIASIPVSATIWMAYHATWWETVMFGLLMVIVALPEMFPAPD